MNWSRCQAVRITCKFVRGDVAAILYRHELLFHTGTISAEAAKAKPGLEYERYRSMIDAQPRPVDLNFEQAVNQLDKPPKLTK